MVAGHRDFGAEREFRQPRLWDIDAHLVVFRRQQGAIGCPA